MFDVIKVERFFSDGCCVNHFSFILAVVKSFHCYLDCLDISTRMVWRFSLSFSYRERRKKNLANHPEYLSAWLIYVGPWCWLRILIKKVKLELIYSSIFINIILHLHMLSSKSLYGIIYYYLSNVKMEGTLFGIYIIIYFY